ncbi:MAG: amidohydrolase family protein [Psychrobium sp.]
MKFIDPHIHLFDRNLGNYGWLKPSNPPQWPDKAMINRDFDQSDLLTTNYEPRGFVHVEAGFDNEQPWREIEWLEATVTMPFKSIACVDLTSEPQAFSDLITRYTQMSSVVGVRHIFDDDAVAILSHANTLTNLQCLSHHQLIFETQISGLDSLAVDAFIDVFQQLPRLRLVLSHSCFAPIDTNEFTVWNQAITKLANLKQLMIKASGWEMVSRQYTDDYVLQVVAELINCFGEARVMLASNFPLTLFSQSYSDLWACYQQLHLANSALKSISFDNAAKLYGFVKIA